MTKGFKVRGRNKLAGLSLLLFALMVTGSVLAFGLIKANVRPGLTVSVWLFLMGVATGLRLSAEKFLSPVEVKFLSGEQVEIVLEVTADMFEDILTDFFSKEADIAATRGPEHRPTNNV
jgi:hypothetical protein